MASDFGRPFSPFRTEEPEPEPPTVANLERRLSMAERAAEQARRDLATEKSRKGLAEAGGQDDDKPSSWYREAVLNERARIFAILRIRSLYANRASPNSSRWEATYPRATLSQPWKKPIEPTPRAAPRRLQT